LHAVFAHRGFETRRIDAQQNLAGIHHLPFLDVDFRNDAAVQALQDLDLAGRNHLALALGDLVDLGNRGPHDEKRE
jgi:hypothetical protein